MAHYPVTASFVFGNTKYKLATCNFDGIRHNAQSRNVIKCKEYDIILCQRIKQDTINHFLDEYNLHKSGVLNNDAYTAVLVKKTIASRQVLPEPQRNEGLQNEQPLDGYDRIQPNRLIAVKVNDRFLVLSWHGRYNTEIKDEKILSFRNLQNVVFALVNTCNKQVIVGGTFNLNAGDVKPTFMHGQPPPAGYFQRIAGPNERINNFCYFYAVLHQVLRVDPAPQRDDDAGGVAESIPRPEQRGEDSTGEENETDTGKSDVDGIAKNFESKVNVDNGKN